MNCTLWVGLGFKEKGIFFYALFVFMCLLGGKFLLLLVSWCPGPLPSQKEGGRKERTKAMTIIALMIVAAIIFFLTLVIDYYCY